MKPDGFHSWKGMIRRCCAPTCKKYCLYGGRGIKVCERWRNSFENFITDMGPRPSKEYTLERENVHGNYEPSNCIWATQKVQQNNRTNNVQIEINGEILNFAQISEKYGISFKNVTSRYYRGFRGTELVKPLTWRNGKYQRLAK